jgi:acetylglutamate kinase
LNLPRVYKVGGPALEGDLFPQLAREVSRGAGQTLLVHGGGRQVDRMLRALSLESRFVNGRRETSPASMEVVEMILSGTLNKSLAAGLTKAGVPAVGISGRDGGLVKARLAAGLGRVGTPDAVNVDLVRALWEGGFVPVLSPVSSDPSGGPVNVNADEVAFGMALALGAASLVYLSDVDGVRVGPQILESLSTEQARRWVGDGTISGGMALKVEVALEAARAGIREVVIAGKARLEGGFPGTRVTEGEVAA